jgi:intraflagellar transport protein 140
LHFVFHTIGKPIYTDLTSCYLSCFSWNGYIKLYNISRYEPKQLINPKCGYDLFENFGEIIMIKCNTQGTHLLLTIATESLMPNGKLYLWEFEKDIMHSYDFLEQIG